MVFFLKDGELVLLLSEDESYLVEVFPRTIHTQNGMIEYKKLKNNKIGGKIKTHLGKEFTLVKPDINDILDKKVKRMPQIITPKDIGQILAHTGVGPGNLVVDAGTGSGFLSIFLAHYIQPGRVVTYEINERFVKVAEKNIEVSGLSKFIKLKQKNVLKGIAERNADLISLDMKNAEKAVKHAYKALKPGGWLVVYSPYIEQVYAVHAEIKKKGFCRIKTVENVVREWQVEKFTRPKTTGLMHTGFLTFARKVG